jgi:hypothetical protein
MMKSLFTLTFLLCLTAVSASAVTPSRQEALAAIATLENDLLSEDAIHAARLITQFAQQSPEVTFTLGRETAPWVLEKRVHNEKDDALYAMLLSVYLAGNAKTQLENGKAEDDPYSGWMAVIRAYRLIQTKRSVTIPSVEELAAMADKGTLQQHAEEVKADLKKPAPSPSPEPVKT